MVRGLIRIPEINREYSSERDLRLTRDALYQMSAPGREPGIYGLKVRSRGDISTDAAINYENIESLVAPMVANQTADNGCEVVRSSADEWSELREMMTSEPARIVRAWKTLPDGLKTAVLSIVGMAEKSDGRAE